MDLLVVLPKFNSKMLAQIFIVLRLICSASASFSEIVIRRIPVCLRCHGVSAVNVRRQAMPMAWQMMGISFQWRAGRYHSEQMSHFGDAPYWEKDE